MHHFNGLVRILETPKIKLYKNKIPLIEFKAELRRPENPLSLIINVKIWGDITYEFIKYYQVNDFVIIEGYFSQDLNFRLNSAQRYYRRGITISIFKHYPYFWVF